MIQQSIAYQNYREALKSIPVPGHGQGCHPYLLTVANYGALAGVSGEQMFDDIRQSIPRGTREVSDRDIDVTIDKALREAGEDRSPPRGSRQGHNSRGRALSKRQKAKLEAQKKERGMKLRDQIMAAGSPDWAELMSSSPVPLSASSSASATFFLQHFYREEDRLLLGPKNATTIKTAREWVAEIEQYGTAELPLIAPNPMTGFLHEAKTGKLSSRCDASVKELRFNLVEFDNMSLEEQCKFWSGIIKEELLNVACLIYSGKKSIHAWLQVDLPNLDAWDQEVKQKLFEEFLIPMGVDRTTKNSSRMSRLPGHLRHETGNWQHLLWLNTPTEPPAPTCNIVPSIVEAFGRKISLLECFEMHPTAKLET